MTTARGTIEHTLQHYADAKNAHDVDAILAQCTEDSRYETVGLGPTIAGKPALRGFYLALFEALPDYAGHFEGSAFGVESAAVWGHFTGTTTGQFLGIDVEAGRPVQVPVTFVCRFREGLVDVDRGYLDTATLAEQLGVPLLAIRPSAADLMGSRDGFVERMPFLDAVRGTPSR